MSSDLLIFIAVVLGGIGVVLLVADIRHRR
jgi:hypothetical protein